MSTVCPTWRSGAVGSKPAFTRIGLPVFSEFSRRSRSSRSWMISAAPFLMYASCSSTGGKFAIRNDYRKLFFIDFITNYRLHDQELTFLEPTRPSWQKTLCLAMVDPAGFYPR